MTIPAGTPLDAYFLLACADDQSAVEEADEDNNCIASPGATVTVTRPDLVEQRGLGPAGDRRARQPASRSPTRCTISGRWPSGSSTTRYYLSLDGVKSAGDKLLTGSRGVPGLAAGASHSGTVTVTIPAATPLNTYFLLACADDLSAVVETNETQQLRRHGDGSGDRDEA